MTLTHWKKQKNPDYIGEWAFQPGEEKVVTIAYAQQETIVGVEGKKEPGLVVHFVENEKPLICNSTNGKMISKHAGSPYIEQWKGTRLTLHLERVKAFGDVTMAVRVKKEKPAPVKTEPIPVCEDCKKPIPAVGNINPHSVAAQTKAKFGVCICFDCGKKRTAAAQNESSDNEE